MPHRVTTFFRNNTVDLSTAVKTLPRPSRPILPERSPSATGAVTYGGGGGKRNSDSHKRLSFQGLTSSARGSSKSLVQALARLDVVIESPPLVSYGPASSSTGALLSGQMVLDVLDESLAIDSLKLKLGLEITKKKPFHAHCQDCSRQTTDLTDWDFLQGPVTLQRGVHSFPFSFLLPGHLPITMKSGLSIIEYVLRGTMTPKTGEPMTMSRALNVKRAIYPSDVPRHSIRIFPPTNVTAHCNLPTVIHPIGEANVQMRLDGVVKRNEDDKTQAQWKLKRITWRLDETHKTISPACAKHAAKLGLEESKKSTPHQEVRTLCTEEIKSGWKSDYSSADGTVEIEFPLSIPTNSRPICDMKAPDGTEVSHVLIVEMIVAEEFASVNKPSQGSPTGAARVLRMHFNATVTERAGMGISWDEEQPPLYEHVPKSPPAYIRADSYYGEPIPFYEDLSPLDGTDSTAVDTSTNMPLHISVA